MLVGCGDGLWSFLDNIRTRGGRGCWCGCKGGVGFALMVFDE